MPRVLIIGIGNPLRGDDAAGRRAADVMARLYADDHATEVLGVQQLTPDLAEAAAEYEMVVLVDAHEGSPAGRVVIEEVTLPAETGSHPFSHHMRPAELLAMTRLLYGSSVRLVLATVTSSAFEVGQPISPAVQAALPELVARIEEVIQDHRRARDWL